VSYHGCFEPGNIYSEPKNSIKLKSEPEKFEPDKSESRISKPTLLSLKISRLTIQV